MKYNICVPIPIKSNDLKEIKILIDRVLAFNPAFVEFRFDYINKVEHLTKKFARQLKNFLENKCYCIFTLRCDSEGGKIRIDKSQRLKILKMLIETQPDFFDIEMNSNLDTLSNIINLSFMKKVNLIFSYHNLEMTPNYEKAKELILRFEEKVIKNALNEFNILGQSVYKIIFTAKNFKDNIVPLEICREFSRYNKKIISFCMDELGIFSRVMCLKLGSFLTYATLEEETASGQINVHTLQQLYKLLFSE